MQNPYRTLTEAPRPGTRLGFQAAEGLFGLRALGFGKSLRNGF